MIVIRLVGRIGFAARGAIFAATGVVPIRFLLDYLGEEFVTAKPGRVMIIARVVGGITPSRSA